MVRKSPDHEHCSCVSALEADIAQLKRRLAVQAAQAPTDRGRRRHTGDDDWMEDLAEQDRRYMQKRLGMR